MGVGFCCVVVNIQKLSVDDVVDDVSGVGAGFVVGP